MAMLTQIKFAQLERDFRNAYRARDTQLVALYGRMIHYLIVEVACGSRAV